MPKKHIVKPMDPVPSKYLNEFMVKSCNLTTADKKTYESISDQFLPSTEGRTAYKYGQGNLAYSGFANSNESKIIGSVDLANKTSSYLVRSMDEANSATFKQLNIILK